MKPVIVVAGPLGSGKSESLFRAMGPRSYALLTGSNNAQFYLQQHKKGLLGGAELPKKMRLLDHLHSGTFDFANWKWTLDKKPDATAAIPQKRTFDATLDALVKATITAVDEGKEPPYPAIVVDEIGEIVHRVYGEFFASPAAIDGKGQPSSYKARDLTKPWLAEIIGKFRALAAYDVAVGMTTLNADPEPTMAAMAGKKPQKSGAFMPNRELAIMLAGMTDGMVLRLARDPDPTEASEADVVGKIRYWEMTIQDDQDCKLRGLSDADCARLKFADLAEIIDAAGFTL